MEKKVKTEVAEEVKVEVSEDETVKQPEVGLRVSHLAGIVGEPERFIIEVVNTGDYSNSVIDIVDFLMTGKVKADLGRALVSAEKRVSRLIYATQWLPSQIVDGLLSESITYAAQVVDSESLVLSDILGGEFKAETEAWLKSSIKNALISLVSQADKGNS